MSSPRKFRVWDGEEMHEPPHNYLLTGTGTLFSYDEDGKVSPALTGEFMFATGLTDAEGTEIYERDVVEDKYGNRGTVKWAEGGSCWEMANYRAPNETTTEQKITVIGNRHENPEILKETT